MKFNFQSYHPYLSYAGAEKYFVTADGNPSFSGWRSQCDPTDMSDDSDTLELWLLGRNAFAALPKFENIAKFNDYYKVHLDGMEALKEALRETSNIKGFVFVNYDGKILAPDFMDSTSCSILDVYWQLREFQKGTDANDYLGHHFLFACLEEIDNAIIGMCLDSCVVHPVIAAANAYANFQAIESGNENFQKARSDLAFRAAVERHRRDPKQAAKQFVKECWDEWKMRPERYGSQSAFAIDVLGKVATTEEGDPIISFDTIVKKWIPHWTKQKK